MIDETFCNTLLTHSSSAAFAWQINAGHAASVTSRMNARKISASEALPGIALLIADLAGVAFGSKLCCGELPSSVSEGFAVSLLGGGVRTIYDATPINVLFYGRGRSLSTLFQAAGNLAAKLPLPLAVAITHASAESIVIHQMICAKTKIESIGTHGCAPYSLQVELTADVSKPFA